MTQGRFLIASAGFAIATAGAVVLVARGTRSSGTGELDAPRGRTLSRPPTEAGGGGAMDDRSSPPGLFDRLTKLRAPTDELVIRLFSPYPVVEECTDRCPPQLRTVGGTEGYQRAGDAVEGITAEIESLAKQPALDREFAGTLWSTVEALRRSAEGKTNRRLRAMFVRGVEGIPADAAFGIGLSLSDLHDEYFDRNRTPRGGGVRILVNRIEGAVSRAGEPGEVLGGVIEFGGDGVGGGSQALDLEEIRALRHPLGLHFWNERAPVVGIALTRSGEVLIYGYWGQGLRRLPADPALRRAIEAVLRKI